MIPRSAESNAKVIISFSFNNLNCGKNLFSLVKSCIIWECVHGKGEGGRITRRSHSKSKVGLNLAVRNDKFSRHIYTVLIAEESRSFKIIVTAKLVRGNFNLLCTTSARSIIINNYTIISYFVEIGIILFLNTSKIINIMRNSARTN